MTKESKKVQSPKPVSVLEQLNAEIDGWLAKWHAADMNPGVLQYDQFFTNCQIDCILELLKGLGIEEEQQNIMFKRMFIKNLEKEYNKHHDNLEKARMQARILGGPAPIELLGPDGRKIGGDM